MADDLSPAETVETNESLTLDQGAEALTDLIGDHADDPVDKAQDKSKTEESEPEADAENAEVEVDDDEVETTDEENQENDEGENDSEKLEDDGFASDDAIVQMSDGSQISVADLKVQTDKRVADFQRDYTQKNMELAESRKAIETTQTEVTNFAQQLQSERDFLLTFQEQFLPQPPDPSLMQEDPMAYMQHKDYYERVVNSYNQMQQHHEQGKAAQAEKTTAESKTELGFREQGILEHHQDLFKGGNSADFKNLIDNDFLPSYGFSADEFRNIADHRIISVIRDATAYRKLQAAKPKAKANVAKKSPMLKGGKRMNPKRKISQDTESRAQHAAKTGTMSDAVATLMDMDL